MLGEHLLYERRSWWEVKRAHAWRQGLYGRARRDKLRWTWVNAFRARAQMTLDTNIIVYFVIGYGCACIVLQYSFAVAGHARGMCAGLHV